MCGRYTNLLTWEEIVRLYRLTLDQKPRNIQPHYNICPTDSVEVVVSTDGKRFVMPMRWGLVPSAPHLMARKQLRGGPSTRLILIVQICKRLPA